MATRNKYSAHRRYRPSHVMRYLEKKGLLVGEMLDFGSGRGFDAEYYKMDAYDPYWTFPELPKKKYDTITCNWVLNVVSPEEEKIILKQIKSLLKPNGKAYITVRRDIKENFNVQDYVQRVVKLNLKTFYKRSQYEVYIMENIKTLDKIKKLCYNYFNKMLAGLAQLVSAPH